jgi:hypothetical protein
VPVDLLGHDRGPVPDQVGDLLDRYSVVAHDRHERVPELSRCPVVAESGLWVPRMLSPLATWEFNAQVRANPGAVHRNCPPERDADARQAPCTHANPAVTWSPHHCIMMY